MATHEALSTFDPSAEDWTTYMDWMKHYFVTNNTADRDKPHFILLSACRPATYMYQVFRNLVKDGKLDTTSSTTL